jgi:hypothetical protein
VSAYGYDSDPDRYSDGEWERTRQEALAARVSEPPTRTTDGDHAPSTLVPGIVRMSLRGDPGDIERLVTAMRGMGIVVWRGDSTGTRSGNSVGYQYFSVEVPKDSDG